MKLKQLSLFLFIVLGLVSCDPYGGYEYWIQNQSDSTIFVSFRLIDNDTIKFQRLANGQEIKIVQYETINGLYDKGLSYLFASCDSLAVYSDTINKIPIVKDITLRENWSYEQDDISTFGNAGNNIYRFVITNEDLK